MRVMREILGWHLQHLRCRTCSSTSAARKSTCLMQLGALTERESSETLGAGGAAGRGSPKKETPASEALLSRVCRALVPKAAHVGILSA